MTELTIHQEKKPIVMKSGLIHWLNAETWEKINEIVANQKAHQFIRISELGNIAINTAEIDGVYTTYQYEEICNIKQGMWKCYYGQWHNKGRNECECKKEMQKKLDRSAQSETMREMYRNPTREERKSSQIKIQSVRQVLEGRGILRPRIESTSRSCVICETPLTGHLKYYCSSHCVLEAKKNDIYGKEDPNRVETEEDVLASIMD